MYENSIRDIMDAQNGNEEVMEKLIINNNRTYMEYSKKVYRKGT